MKTGQSILSVFLAFLVMLSATAVGGVYLTAFAIDGGETTVKVTNWDGSAALQYKQSKTFEFEAQNLPEGAAVHVYYNGEDRGEGTYINVEKPTEDFTVEAKVLDKDGGEIASSGEIKVAVNHGFLDRLKDFIQNTFGTASDAVMDIFGAIFMRIWIFLHR